MKSHKTDTALPTKEASEDFKAGTTEHPAHEQSSRFERSQPVQGKDARPSVDAKPERLSPREEITKQMEANNLWIAENREDGPGVHQHELANAELTHRLIDMDTAAREADRTSESLKA